MTRLNCFIAILSLLIALLERNIGTAALRSQVLLHRIADDEFLGVEKRHWLRLRSTLPAGRYDDDDLLAEIRRFAVEAAHRFDPGHGGQATFSTFLWHHIQMRCVQLHTHAWLPKNYPQNETKGELWLKADSEWGDHNPGPDYTESSYTESASAKTDYTVETKDVLANLTPESEELFRRIAADLSLVEMAAKPRNQKRLSDRLGVARAKVDRMMVEVRKLRAKGAI
jgi:hypothetical protein